MKYFDNSMPAQAGTGDATGQYVPSPCPYCPPRCPHCGRPYGVQPYYPVYPDYPYWINPVTWT